MTTGVQQLQQDLNAMGGQQPEMSLQDKVNQLRELVITRERLIALIDSEGGLEAFKINTAESRGELKALLNIRVMPPEGQDNGGAAPPQPVVGPGSTPIKVTK